MNQVVLAGFEDSISRTLSAEAFDPGQDKLAIINNNAREAAIFPSACLVRMPIAMHTRTSPQTTTNDDVQTIK